MQTVPLRVGIRIDRRRQVADALWEVGQQPDQLAAAGAERLAQLRRVGAARQVLERLDERAVRSAHDGVTGAVEHQRSVGRSFGGELAHQPALAGARLAPEQHDPASLALRAGHQRAQRLELRCAAGEWKT